MKKVSNKDSYVQRMPKLVKQIMSNLPAVCIGETVDVETATRGTGVGPLRGTFGAKR